MPACVCSSGPRWDPVAASYFVTFVKSRPRRVLQGSAPARQGSGQQAPGTQPGVVFMQTHDFVQLPFLWPLSKGLGGHLHPCDTKCDG